MERYAHKTPWKPLEKEKLKKKIYSQNAYPVMSRFQTFSALH